MTPGGRRVTCVAALGPDRLIGDGPRIPWRVPGEQQVFRRASVGQVVVMGRATYESIGRPLPDRTTVVLTRDPSWRPGHDGVLLAASLDEAVRAVDRVGTAVAGDPPRRLVVAGGAQVYAAALAVPDLVDVQLLTEIDPDRVDVDAVTDPVRYPSFDPAAWTATDREPHDGFVVVTLERAGGRSIRL